MYVAAVKHCEASMQHLVCCYVANRQILYYLHYNVTIFLFPAICCMFCIGLCATKACDAGRAANKWLMVNIQNVQEFSCQVLNRDVWSNSTVKTVVHEHFILWQVRKLCRNSVIRLCRAVENSLFDCFFP